MRPHLDGLDGLLLLENLVDKPMLDIDPSRERTLQITQQLLVARRALKGILLQNRVALGCLDKEVGESHEPITITGKDSSAVTEPYPPADPGRMQMNNIGNGGDTHHRQRLPLFRAFAKT